MTGTRIYIIWLNIRQRTGNKNHPQYGSYGGRGIKLCARWQVFENFLDDMGNGSDVSLSVDRINSNGDYCPENCRWATDVQQAQNINKSKLNISGRTGVFWTERLQKWQIAITANGQRIYGGVFESFDEAVAAREKLEIIYHGKIRSADYEKQKTTKGE